jgi:hypothetical protein
VVINLKGSIMARHIFAGSLHYGHFNNSIDTIVQSIKSNFKALPDDAVISITKDDHVYITLGQLNENLEFNATHYFWSMIN